MHLACVDFEGDECGWQVYIYISISFSDTIYVKSFKYLLIELGVLNCLFQPLKRKSAAANYGQGIGDQDPVSGCANVNSPVQTPISGKDAQKVPRTSKARSASQAVTSNVGEDFR